MDIRLLQASQTGNINFLHQLLIENPLILHINAILSTENPLHIASIAGHLDFAKEMVRLKPEFTKEINQDGFSPLHIAAAAGHVKMVQELMKPDPNLLCRIAGKEKKTPLHFAAIKGRVDAIIAMLLACPDCIEDVTLQKETALHLAVKNNQMEAVRVMVDWIRDMKKEHVMNMKDEEGNTILHLATWKKQRQVVELFLDDETIRSGALEVNAINCSGLTALDVLMIFPSEAGDREIADILWRAGAMRARDITLFPDPLSQPVNHTSISIPTTPAEHQTPHANNPLEYFKFKKGRDSPSEARGTLLIIAVLVATATYQVGVSPPGGVWQENYIPDSSHSTGSTIMNKAHYAGKSIFASSNGISYCLFMLFNSIGFSVSLLMINILTSRFPLQFELQICMIAMYFTYNTATASITPDSIKLYIVLITSIMPALVPALVPPLAKFVRVNAKRVKESVVSMFYQIITVCS